MINILDKSKTKKIEEAIKNKTPIIISGSPGPTGKTTLKNNLLELGAIVYEKWECLEIEID